MTVPPTASTLSRKVQSAVAGTPADQLVHDLHGKRGEGRTKSLREQCQEHLGHCASNKLSANWGIHEGLLWKLISGWLTSKAGQGLLRVEAMNRRDTLQPPWRGG